MKTKDQEVRLAMIDPFLIVKEFPFGALIIDLKSAQACTWMKLSEEYSGTLRKDVLYTGVLIGPNNERTEGFMCDITFPAHRTVNGPHNLFFDDAIVWNERGEVISKKEWNKIQKLIWDNYK